MKFFFFLAIIVTFVLFFITRGVLVFREKWAADLKYGIIGDNIVHNTLVEIVGTTLPIIILLLISFPSFTLLYTVDEQGDSELTLKVLGRQGYWSYEYFPIVLEQVGEELDELIEEIIDISFDSYLDQDFEESSTYRLLKVDNSIFLPSNFFARFLVTSSDVIHSGAIPSLGVKVDACPGRLNQHVVEPQGFGYFFGQCSELCGLNHAFMPIQLVVSSYEIFVQGVYSFV